MRTNPNQKIITIQKTKCNKQNLYTTINIQAMEQAAIDLDAGAFKLWCYFMKNQDTYKFSLSNTDVKDRFGIKIKQYNNAVQELIAKGYLINTSGNQFTFYDMPVVDTKKDNENNINNIVDTKKDNAVVLKGNNTLSSKVIRNITNNTEDNTTFSELLTHKKEKGSFTEPIPITINELEQYNISPNNLISTTNGLLIYQDKYLKPVKELFNF